MCVHSFIGYDKNYNVRVANILPYNYACWGCGSGKYGSYNYNPTGHIQIELCEDNLWNEEYFNEVYRVAAEYCAMLCKKFNLQPSSIVSHAEAHKKGYASNHADCDHWFTIHGKTMGQFRSLVSSILGQSTKYLVRVTTDILNVRKGAGTNYPIVTTVKRNEVYTIVGEIVVGNEIWGKLKSGAGFICLTYTAKL
jgi:N-acetylmuramoyl-L-alanine amidase CwlA